jgi:hypothetical protein
MEKDTTARKPAACARTYGLAKIFGLITFAGLALAAMVQFGSATAFVWLVVMFVSLSYFALRQTACQRGATDERHRAATNVGADNKSQPQDPQCG